MQKVVGWPDDLFIEKNVLASLECSICMGILRDAVVHSCGKSFCRACVQELDTCPWCDGATQWKPNLDLRNVILSQRVQCACSWEGTLGDYAAHEKQECNLTLVECKFQSWLKCSCDRKPRGEAPAYFYSKADEHKSLAQALTSGKRRRDEDTNSGAEGLVADAAPVAEPLPGPCAGTPADAGAIADTVEAHAAANAHVLVQPPLAAACDALEALLMRSNKDSLVDEINSALQRLVDLMPSAEDEGAGACAQRQLVGARDPLVEYAENPLHAPQLNALKTSRQTRDTPMKALRAQLCRELLVLLDGPDRLTGIQLG